MTYTQTRGSSTGRADDHDAVDDVLRLLEPDGSRIADDTRPARTVTVPPALVVRGSTSASVPAALRRPEPIDEEKAHG